MECCCYPIDDFEGPSVSSEHWPKARKEHTCCECGDTIPKGVTYELVSGLWDGYWNTYKTCRGCTRLRDDMACGQGWIIEGLDEAVRECFGFSLRDEPEEINDDDD